MKKLFTYGILLLTLTFFHRVNGQNIILPSKQIPVLACGGPWQNETTIERYKELKEAGITHNLTYFSDVNQMEKALNIAKEVGIEMIVHCPEVLSDTKRTIERFKNNPAVAGYYISDEPSRVQFYELAEKVKEIRSIDNSNFCYINLLPNYAEIKDLGTKTYREHVSLFIKEVDVQHLSFDHYPIIGDLLRERWYENLEIFSEEANKAGKSFWAYVLSVAHDPYPIPTLAELRLQVFSNLAYGAQGIEYFTYRTPAPDNTWNFHHGPLTLEAKRSEVYDRIKQVNQEIKNLSGVFLGAEVLWVKHTGLEIPFGTKRLIRLPKVIKIFETEGTGAVVSLLKNGKNHFLVVVNRDFKNSMKLTIEGDSELKKVLKDGSCVPAETYIRTMEIDAGDVAIYMWPN